VLLARVPTTRVSRLRPGRLLYVHDAPSMRALYIDVERLDR